MPLFVVLKRFEIWLLLAVVGVLIYVALQPVEPEVEEAPAPIATAVLPGVESKPSTEAAETPEDYPAVALDSITVKKSGEGSLVEITILARSTTDSEVSDAAISAMTASGEPVERFFEPFRETAMLFPDEESLVTTRWWLESPTESLWLEVQGQKIEAPLSQ